MQQVEAGKAALVDNCGQRVVLRRAARWPQLLTGGWRRVRSRAPHTQVARCLPR